MRKALKKILKAKKDIIFPLSLGALVVLVPVIILTYNKPTQLVEAWYNDNWLYRTPFAIYESGASGDSNKKVLFEFDTSTAITNGKMQSDCDDVRFTDNLGNPLRHYLDTSGGACNTVSTDFYVLMPVIEKRWSVVYMYYGNPSAANIGEASQFSEATYTPDTGPSTGTEEIGPAPSGHWPFNEGVDNTCSGGTNDTCDNTQAANDGSLSGATWATPDFCVDGTCLKFDGTDDVVTVTASPEIDLNNQSGFSVCGWIKPLSDGESANGGEMWSKGSSYLRVDTESSGTAEVSAAFDLATTDATLNTSLTINLDEWSHICATYTDDADDELTIYVNGIDAGSSTDGVGSPANDSASNMEIGGDSSNNFDGWIDDVKVFIYERSADDIKTEYVSFAGNAGSAYSAGRPNNDFLNKGLIGYWPLNEDTANTCTGGVNDSCDASGNGFDGAWNGPPTVSNGKFNDALNFTGTTGQYVNLGDQAEFEIEVLTISAWINKDNVDCPFNSCPIFAKGESSNTGYGLNIQKNTNYYVHFSINDQNQSVYGDTIIQPDEWYHVAVTMDGSEIKLYVNGKIDKVAAQTETPSFGTEVVSIGAKMSGFDLVFDGDIDDVRFYDRVLEPVEVENLYDWAPPPVMYLNLNENTGTSTVYDRSTNAYNGTLTAIDEGDWQPGRFGSALNLDGAAEYITISSEGSNFSIDTFTYSMWINRPSGAAAGEILLSNEDASSDGIRIFTSSNSPVCRYNTTSLTTGVTLSADTWYHISCASDGSTIYFYLNGTLYDTDTVPSSVAETANMVIGAESYGTPSTFLTGLIDEVKVYDYPRTNEQVIKDMNAGHPIGGSPVASQVAYWPMDELLGDTAYDVSGNGMDGDLSGSGTACPGTASTCPSYSNGKFYGDFVFNGTGDYIDVAADPIINLNKKTGYTICAWVNPDSDGENNTGEIWSKGSTYLRTDTEDPGVSVELSASFDLATTDATFNSTTTIPINDWSHVCVGYTDDADDEITMYINGIYEGTSTDGVGSPADDSASTAQIGGDSSNNFDGQIDELKIYASELTSSEVKIDYNYNSSLKLGTVSTDPDNSNLPFDYAKGLNCLPGDSTSCAAPISFYNFEQNTGTSTIFDKSGLSHDLTMAGLADAAYTVGVKGAGLEFSDSADQLSCTDANCGGTGASGMDVGALEDFTLTGWFKTSTAANAILIGKKNDIAASSAGYGFGLINTAGGAARCQVGDGTNTYWVQPTSGPGTGLQDGEWHHFVCAMDRTQDIVVLFIDGKYVGFNGPTSLGSFDNTVDFTIGNAGNGTLDYTGVIDEVKFYKYLRTPSQAGWDHNRGRPILHYRFDECSGTAVRNGGWLSGFEGTIQIGGTGTQDESGLCDNVDTTEAWYNGRNGKYEASLSFDGTDDNVDVTADQFLHVDDQQALSLCAWVYPNSDGENDIGEIWTKGNSYLRVDSESGGAVEVSGYLDLVTADASHNTTDTIPIDEWSHVCMTWSNDADDEISIYLNGVLEGSSTNGSGATADDTASTNWQIGGGTNNFDGQIDEVTYYNIELTQELVQYDMNRQSGIRFD